ncbi:hypothetical protein [Roseateles sp.]|uniref:hypothetical protein n=1 Tax=Roseateles sp. TaxID=1971397 RepID=UPI0025E263D4|nr:hypothetical protein [Roseateles sp.]MBV8036451.1 hypothetical protein [Roseateles sp.]
MNLHRNIRGWLLWLAFLLPIAQAMAGVHALSHVTGERQGDGIAHLVHCDLCLTAADLTGAAPPAEPSVLPAGVAVEACAKAPLAGVVERAAAWLPPARAPPAST